jgi:connector enhancer of kinase suppressor of Ras 2
MKILWKKKFFGIRSPFTGQLDYQDRKTELLKLSLAIATCAQRDRFAERPVEEIRTSCKELARMADSIIQDIVDPLILQPASLDLATLKKRAGDDLVSSTDVTEFWTSSVVLYSE